MDFRIEQRIGAARTAVEQALADADFVTATSDLPRVSDCAVLAAHRDDDLLRLQIHRRFDADLPAAARRVVDPARLTWVEHVHYDLAAHRGSHRIDPDHYGNRLDCAFTTALDEEAGDTVRVTIGRMKVGVPVVGERVAGAIVSGLEEYAAAEAELLTRWCDSG